MVPLVSLSTLRRGLQSLLARHPHLYCRLLGWIHRGRLEQRIYLTLTRPGDVVFDVGANQGHFTLLFADLVGPSGEVHAFEPLPPTFAHLRTAVEQHPRADRVLLNNVACTEHPCEITLHVPDDDGGQASLRRQREGSWRSAEGLSMLPVQAIRLDDYERGRAADQVDFVKCDVEGAELLVLRGMTNKLARHSPLLFLEVNAAWTEPFGYRPADLIAFLELMGYDSFYLVTDQISPMADPGATVAMAAASEAINVLCAHAEHHAERLQSLAVIRSH